MSKVIKLSTILGLTQDGASKFKKLILDYTKYFGDKGGDFLGRKNTYAPKEGTLDDPSKKAYTKVVTTVDEKLDYFEKTSGDFLKLAMDVEKTNSSGTATATLMVGEENWGVYSSLELMRMKGILEAHSLKDMIQKIPVRKDSEIYEKVDAEKNPEYQNRGVFQKPEIKSVAKTTVIEEYVLEDPNVKRDPSLKYEPKVSKRNILTEVGDATSQEFSGEWSHTQRANALNKIDVLKTSISKALAEANDVEVIPSDFTAKRLFEYLFKQS